MSTDAVVLGIHHSGISVEDLDTALAFWEPFLGTRRACGGLDRPYLASSVGYPGVAIEAALFDLPDGRMLELLDYQVEGRERQPDDSFHPGNAHVPDGRPTATSAWRRAVDAERGPAEPGRARSRSMRARTRSARGATCGCPTATRSSSSSRTVPLP